MFDSLRIIMQNNLHDDDIDAMWQITASFFSVAWTPTKSRARLDPEQIWAWNADTCVSEIIIGTHPHVSLVYAFNMFTKNVLILMLRKYFH